MAVEARRLYEADGVNNEADEPGDWTGEELLALGGDDGALEEGGGRDDG